jgi:hypothetical protein
MANLWLLAFFNSSTLRGRGSSYLLQPADYFSGQRVRAHPKHARRSDVGFSQ